MNKIALVLTSYEMEEMDYIQLDVNNALAASMKWTIFWLDVNNGSLYGDFHEEVHMRIPEGIPNPDNKVRRVRKSLYGLNRHQGNGFPSYMGSYRSRDLNSQGKIIPCS